MHCVIDGIPAADHIVLLPNQQRIEIDVDFADGIMGTVCVVVQNSTTLLTRTSPVYVQIAATDSHLCKCLYQIGIKSCQNLEITNKRHWSVLLYAISSHNTVHPITLH